MERPRDGGGDGERERMERVGEMGQWKETNDMETDRERGEHTYKKGREIENIK